MCVCTVCVSVCAALHEQHWYLPKSFFSGFVMVNTPVYRSSLTEMIFVMLQYNYYCDPLMFKFTILQKRKR